MAGAGRGRRCAALHGWPGLPGAAAQAAAAGTPRHSARQRIRLDRARTAGVRRHGYRDDHHDRLRGARPGRVQRHGNGRSPTSGPALRGRAGPPGSAAQAVAAGTPRAASDARGGRVACPGTGRVFRHGHRLSRRHRQFRARTGRVQRHGHRDDQCDRLGCPCAASVQRRRARAYAASTALHGRPGVPRGPAPAVPAGASRTAACYLVGQLRTRPGRVRRHGATAPATGRAVRRRPELAAAPETAPAAGTRHSPADRSRHLRARPPGVRRHHSDRLPVPAESAVPAVRDAGQRHLDRHHRLRLPAAGAGHHARASR